MRIPNAAFWTAVLLSPSIICAAQAGPGGAQSSATAPPAAASAAPAAAPPAPAPPPPPSGILQPSFQAVREALGSLRVERWKKGSVRDEASDDIHSLLNDMQTNLPPLVQDADGGPGTLSKMLPLAKHVDAVYDVLLRVVEASRMAAPDDQANSLRQAQATLGAARLAFDERMQEAAGVQEKQLSDLRVTVQKQAAFRCPAPPPAPDCPKAPVKKPVRRKPATSAAPGASGSPASGAPAVQTGPGAKTPATPQKNPQKPAGQQQTPSQNNSKPGL